MNEIQLNDTDKLFVAEAVKKRVTKAVKDLRADTDAALLEAYEKDGTTTKRSLLFGKEAGSYTLPISEGKPDSTITEWSLVDDEAYLQWLDDNKQAAVDYAFFYFQEFAEYHVNKTGEVPTGLSVETTAIPGTPKGQPGTPRLTVKDDVVFDKLGEMGLLESMNTLLLGGE